MEGTQSTNSSQSTDNVDQVLLAGTSSLKTQNGPFPNELDHWNWGGFFLSWIWGIGMGNAIAIVLGLFTSIIGSIIIGAKGNEWAWSSRKFESIEQFKLVQKAWAKVGVIIFVVWMLLFGGSITIFVLMTRTVVKTVGGGLQAVQESINEAQLRPAHVNKLPVETNIVYQQVNMRRIFPDSPPANYNISYYDDPDLNKIFKKMVTINPEEHSAPDAANYDLRISPWNGKTEEFLLPEGVPRSSLVSVTLQNGTVAQSYSGVIVIGVNSYRYVYSIFWIKNSLLFEVIASKYLDQPDPTKLVNENVIRVNALNYANKLSINSIYLFSK